ncbi:uncharacterized protein DUF4136 [Algoriphagus boseongensis]|uniref:Uncharacterized protein DUF4136 n=1 Tax=Algoriphagus boseongensis TaxID=1442587 RepID=A0A4R6T8E2_9BACT|nr:DUF4136 domain-containing protein [Algoriphagus boseongensis]TDQ18423.1 uncharacterized protein DUF4136 [Algoriphagus boseongensis]
MKKLSQIIWVALLAFFGGCYPGGIQFYEDTDIVYTTSKEEFDFNSRSTYAMPDKIVIDVEIKDGDTTYIYMKDQFAQPILQNIASNLQNYGWNRVGINQKPDMVMTPSATKSTTVFYSWWYDWWYGGWYPGWGWYYPPYYNVSAYTTGTVILNFSDPDDTNIVGESPTAWLMVGNGLMSNSNDVTRVTKAIDQAFVQSPYLNTK